jgi:hypothetical protein
LKAANWEQLASRLIEANLYQELKVPKPVFEKSMQIYMMEPERRTVYEEEMVALSEKFRIRKQQELTKEECFKSVASLEMAKFEAQKKMYMIVRQQKLQPQMINALIKVEKLKADDQFFNESGIEEEDVEPSIKRLNLEADPEYLGIVEEWSKQSKDFLDEKRKESEVVMAKMKEM